MSKKEVAQKTPKNRKTQNGNKLPPIVPVKQKSIKTVKGGGKK
jgi:hypothetical protein